jgi:hypothetical protein
LLILTNKLTSVFTFHFGKFVYTPAKLGIRREFGIHKSFKNLLRNCDPDYPGPNADQVHIVVLDTLVGAVGVMREGGPDPGDLISGDRSTNSGSAHQDTSIRFSREDRSGDSLRDIREVDRVFRVRSVVSHFVAQRFQMLDDRGFHRKSRMIATNGYFHFNLLVC